MLSNPHQSVEKLNGTNRLRQILFAFSCVIALLCYYFFIDFKTTENQALSGEIITANTPVYATSSQDGFLAFLFNYFGGFIYLMPLVLIYTAYLVFYKIHSVKTLDLFKVGIFILGFNCLVIGLTSLFSFIGRDAFSGYGGILGDFLTMLFASLVSSALAPLISLLVCLCGFCLFLLKTPLEIIDILGIFAAKLLKLKNKEEPVKRSIIGTQIDQEQEQDTQEKPYKAPFSFNISKEAIEKSSSIIKNLTSKVKKDQDTKPQVDPAFDAYNGSENNQDLMNKANFENHRNSFLDRTEPSFGNEPADSVAFGQNQNYNPKFQTEQGFAQNNFEENYDDAYTHNQAYSLGKINNTADTKDYIETNTQNKINSYDVSLQAQDTLNFMHQDKVNKVQSDDAIVYFQNQRVEENNNQTTRNFDPEATIVVRGDGSKRSLFSSDDRNFNNNNSNSNANVLNNSSNNKTDETTTIVQRGDKSKRPLFGEKSDAALEADKNSNVVARANNSANITTHGNVLISSDENGIATTIVTRGNAKPNNAAATTEVDSKEVTAPNVETNASEDNIDSVNNEVKATTQTSDADYGVSEDVESKLEDDITQVEQDSSAMQNVIRFTQESEMPLTTFEVASLSPAFIPSREDNQVSTNVSNKTRDSGFLKRDNNMLDKNTVLVSEKDSSYTYQRASRGVLSDSPAKTENKETHSQEFFASEDNFNNTYQNYNSSEQNKVHDKVEPLTSFAADNNTLTNRSDVYTNLSSSTNTGVSDDYIPQEIETIKQDDIVDNDNVGLDRPALNNTNYPSYMANSSNTHVNTMTKMPTVAFTKSMITAPTFEYDDTRPSISLLTPSSDSVEVDTSALEDVAHRIDAFMQNFGVRAKVARFLNGPVITRYDIALEPGVRSATISSLATDLCRDLMVATVRVIDVIPGTQFVGLEVPNPKRKMINLYDVVKEDDFTNTKAKLPLTLGVSVTGQPVIVDLAVAPHLLIAGTTGSGKSAGLNAMLVSMLLKCSPKELRLILIDPKQLEFNLYDGIPHLITPVITDVAEKTSSALRWCVEEMERRYKLIADMGARKLDEYNEIIKKAHENGNKVYDPTWSAEMGGTPPELKTLPYIVVVIEEYADLIAQVQGKKKSENSPEALIARLTQKARAAGIHVILATQTPRVDVVTSVIKANMPSRIAYTVQSSIDSKVILDEVGAEKLLGYGDMLSKFYGYNNSSTFRAHGAFVSNEDVQRIADRWKEIGGVPEFIEGVTEIKDAEVEDDNVGSNTQQLDKIFDDAAAFAREFYAAKQKYPTVSDYQARFGLGWSRAKKIVYQLKREGVIDD